MISEKLYRLLLVAYPTDHRREYGELMVQMFRDRMRRDGGGFGILNVWAEMVVDLAVSAYREHRNRRVMTTGALTDTVPLRPEVACAALLLFFGLGLAGQFTNWTLFGLTWSNGGLVPFWVFSTAGIAVPFALLTLSYLLVRRLDHPILPQLWLYVIVASAIGGLGHILFTLTYLHSGNEYTWTAIAVEAVLLPVLVWFARKVSATSFGHSLLFIGLATVMKIPSIYLPFIPALAWPLHIYTTLLTGGVLLRGLAVWTLVNTQVFALSTRTALSAMLAMVLPGAALYVIASNFWAHAVSLAPSVAFHIIQLFIVPALAASITYGVRVRGQGEPPFGLKSQAA